MARPLKKGLDYFPLDVDLIHNIKIRKIMRACGAQSVAVLVDLLGSIYGDEGYYMQWDDDSCFLVADDVGTSEAAVQEIVAKAVQVGFFDSGMYDNQSILTSKGIQERYRMAAKKKKDSSIDPKFRLLKTVSSAQNGVSDVDNPVSGSDNPQSKVKESKVNKIKKRPHSGKPKYGPDDLPYQVAEHLLKRIREHNPDFKQPNLQHWANDARLAHERDRRDYAKLDRMVDWCQDDDFWQGNILSTKKLREKYDQLAAQANRNFKKGKASVHETLPDWARRDNDQTQAKPKQLSAEQQAELDERMRRLRERSKKQEEIS